MQIPRPAFPICSQRNACLSSAAAAAASRPNPPEEYSLEAFDSRPLVAPVAEMALDSELNLPQTKNSSTMPAATCRLEQDLLLAAPRPV